MQRSIVVWLIALVGSLLIGAAVPTIAQAETCSPDGKICLVTETDPNHPLIPPTTLEFRVTSEATYFSGRLVQYGPGTTNLWADDLPPADSDSIETINAYAGSENFRSEANFQVPVLAAAVNYSVTITRTKKQVVATYQFDARTPLKAVVRISLDSFKGGTHILTHRGTTQITGLEHQVLTVVLPRKVINRKCGTKLYPHCSVLAVGQSWSGSYLVDQGTNDRKRVK